MIKYSIITRCSRLENLGIVSTSIFKEGYDIKWHIIFDTSRLKSIPARLLTELQNPNIIFHFIPSEEGDYLYPQMSVLASIIKDRFIVVVDDDNIVHPNFYKLVSEAIKKTDGTKRIFVVNQIVNGRDFTGLQVREAKPENMKFQGVDVAQLIIHSSVFSEYNYESGYAGDSQMVGKIYEENPTWFDFIEKNLCYYNYIENKPESKVPKILVVTDEHVDLKSHKAAEYEEDSLAVVTLTDDTGIEVAISTFNPDAIVTVPEDWTKYPNLSKLPLQIRSKWISLPKIDENTGEKAYRCSMFNILNNDNSQLISYFTPIYNTGKKLLRTYRSLQNQTYNNWEWVIVNDSSDNGLTVKIAEEIALKDPRVKVYDFNNKSGGIIGEVKYRAASLCKGYLLAELDHDDYLSHNCTELLFSASQKHPEIGFFYSDSAEVNDNWESLHYGPGFALGYGKYEKVIVDGVEYDSCISPNINPKTIRHIVGVPNHVRAWRRDIYFKIGGHNRALSVADDYELLIRTFLNTEMMRIPKLCYLQFIHNSNTTDISRADIQRRVRTIMYHYNDRIAERFKELGVEDYVYKENKDYPLSVESRYGDQENYVNKIFEL